MDACHGIGEAPVATTTGCPRFAEISPLDHHCFGVATLVAALFALLLGCLVALALVNVRAAQGDSLQ